MDRCGGIQRLQARPAQVSCNRFVYPRDIVDTYVRGIVMFPESIEINLRPLPEYELKEVVGR